MTDLVQKLVGALEWTIRELDRNTCTHEETHRGGAIWTICDGCGMNWADDRGGFKPYKEPTQLKAARAALSEAKAGGWQTPPDMIRFARTVLALRPQAVPMTDEQIVAALKACDREDPSKEGWIWRTRIKWARAVEAHHGITAPAGGEKQA